MGDVGPVVHQLVSSNRSHSTTSRRGRPPKTKLISVPILMNQVQSESFVEPCNVELVNDENVAPMETQIVTSTAKRGSPSSVSVLGQHNTSVNHSQSKRKMGYHNKDSIPVVCTVNSVSRSGRIRKPNKNTMR